MNTMDAMCAIVEQVALRNATLDVAIKPLVQMQGEMEARKKVAMFIALLRGHNINRREVRSTRTGLLVECTCCGMVVDVPRYPWPNQPGICGRALEFRCPSNREAGGTLR